MSKLWDDVQAKQGIIVDSAGTVAPQLTNAQAVAIAADWYQAATIAGVEWKWWYAVAAPAYVSGADPAAFLPVDDTTALWLAIYGLASDMDRQDRMPPPRELQPDCASFQNAWPAIRNAMAADASNAPPCPNPDEVRFPVPGKPAEEWPCIKKNPWKDKVPDPLRPIRDFGTLVLRAAIVLGAFLLLTKED